MKTVFIDGNQGTTGLRIRERLAGREGVTVVSLPEEERKLLPSRIRMAKQADASILCLPDEASRELVAALPDGEGRIIDASTAHRTDPRFVYGFPELKPHAAERIAASRRIAVPGCHATGAISLLYPLLKAGALAPDAPLCLTSLTGYSGGGKKMIARYEAANRDRALDGPLPYAVGQEHKHLPEIVSVCGLTQPPIIQPIVCDVYSYMLVGLPLWGGLLRQSLDAEGLTALYRAHYPAGGLVQVLDPNPEKELDSLALAGTDGLQLFVTGNGPRMIAYARFDNLGKGASGAAVECLNLAFGFPPETGLVLPGATARA